MLNALVQRDHTPLEPVLLFASFVLLAQLLLVTRVSVRIQRLDLMLLTESASALLAIPPTMILFLTEKLSVTHVTLDFITMLKALMYALPLDKDNLLTYLGQQAFNLALQGLYQ